MIKKEVLRGKKNFNLVYKKGNSIADKYVVLIYLKNGLKYNRVAFLASKKVGNSVKRNRAKRLMREAFRKESLNVKKGFDIIFIARKSILEVKMQKVEESISKELKRKKLI